jgi:chemotaxis regulatin CheY-phosphate phosphatase CheZ
VLRGLILKTAEDRLQRGDLDKDDARHLTEQRDEFLSSFDTITGWSNLEHRQVALTAVLSTLVIALHGQVQEDLIQGLRRDFTRSANKARKAAGVDEIIESRARILWLRWDSFKYNDLGTAKTIHKDVVADLQDCISTDPNKIPPKWYPVKSPNADSDRREIGRIAKRVAKIVR